MKTKLLLFAVFLLVCSTAFSQESDNAKYIETCGVLRIRKGGWICWIF